MPQTPRELIDAAEASGDWNAVADWFENFDWSQAEEIPVGEFLLERTVNAQDRSEDQVAEVVSAARARGTTWERIGEILGMSARDARQRYESPTDQPEPVSQ